MPAYPPSEFQRVLLTSGFPQTSASPLAVILHDARNKLIVFSTYLDERTQELKRQDYVEMTRITEAVRTETRRLFVLAENGIFDKTKLANDMERLRFQFDPMLSAVQDAPGKRYAVSADTLETAVREFGDLIERGVKLARNGATSENAESHRPSGSISPVCEKAGKRNLSDLVSRVGETYAGFNPEVQFNLNIEKNCAVPCDEHEIRRCLENLLNNAIQSLPSEEEETAERGRITVVLRKTVYYADKKKPFSEIADGTYISLQVKDNGSGISKGVMGLLSDYLVTTKAGGSGIGLKSVRRCVLDHRGHVFVESGEGWGTQVTILLPAA